MILEEVSVYHRTGQWCRGVRTGDNVVAYDVAILPRWQVPGLPTTDRCFVLADEGVQITRPNTFSGTLRGGWYIDVVDVEEAEPGRLVVHDRAIDFVLPATSLRYEVLDLDEFADALENGEIDTATAIRALRTTQRFIDSHLRNLDEDALTSWPDFPPATVAKLAELPPF
ncbi:hypothetical protein FB561_6270 [Kribbella amoyensis]|uniref:DUF402 domain-containing protein n=1 Tax=Kribbella amoyensis TaxID=996641 RepID=A0A561B788_9ACTN|nr:DUF402 domain-containing protein [Kribbella amoyensis]TWD74836.1 hypothetical protein FB561_6270 [Kribbella amoyensis]